MRWAKELRADQVTKSNLIVGMGETEDEVYEAMRDLRADRLRRPDDRPVPAAERVVAPAGRSLGPPRRVRPLQGVTAKSELGFAWVESGPLVRSSYHAGKQYRSAAARLAS